MMNLPLTVMIAGSRCDTVVYPSELLGPRALSVYAACAASLHLPGDVAECGVANGTTAAGIRKLIQVSGADRNLHLFDTFGMVKIGGEEAGVDIIDGHARSIGDVAALLPDKESTYFHIGLFKDTFPLFNTPLCFMHADSDLFESTQQAIGLAERLIVPGGCLVLDDYGNEWEGVMEAVETTMSRKLWWTYIVAGSSQMVAIRK